MTISPLAGKPARKEMLVDLSRLEREYFECRPDLDDPAQRASFGTRGHRGSPFRGSFTEAHIWVVPRDPEDKGPNLSFQGRDGRPRSRSWLDLDLYGPDQQAEVERLVDLGAGRYPWRSYRRPTCRAIRSGPQAPPAPA